MKSSSSVLLAFFLTVWLVSVSEVSGAQKERFGNAVRMDKPFSLDEEKQLKP